MKKHHYLTALVLTSALSMAVFAADSVPETGTQKMRSRLEQLFIWRVSDRLHLSPDEEAKFTAEYKKLSNERSEASSKMDSILGKLAGEKSKSAKVKLLSDYEAVFKKYTDIQQEEMTEMKKLFDTDRLADYVLLKRDMRHRFREVLAKNGEDANKSKAKEVSPPPEDEK